MLHRLRGHAALINFYTGTFFEMVEAIGHEKTQKRQKRRGRRKEIPRSLWSFFVSNPLRVQLTPFLFVPPGFLPPAEVSLAIAPRSQTPFGNALVCATPLLLRYSARNRVSRRSGTFPNGVWERETFFKLRHPERSFYFGLFAEEDARLSRRTGRHQRARRPEVDGFFGAF